jgi:16S rRNA (guanine527-N7)-methyltransferase
MNTELLVDGMNKLGIAASDRQIAGLDIFYTELERWNGRMNLVRAGGDALIIRHILDSLAGLPSIRELTPGTLMDVGTGAGLPGIVLSLFLPDTQVTLLDRSAKRISFLRNAVALLDLDGCLVVEGELEHEKRLYDLVCCRAFRPLKQTFSKLAARLNPGGSIVFYKGTKTAVAKEVAELGGEHKGYELKVVPVTVPFLEEERQLLLFRDTNR